MKVVFVLPAVRTPVGKARHERLKTVRPDDLGPAAWAGQALWNWRRK